MGIISRFKDIMSANINALLDKAEDPSKMIDQYLRNLESDLGKVKAETAAVMAEETRCKRQLDECTAEINKYQNYAMKAVQAGNDDDARKFLAKKAELAERLASLQKNLDLANANAAKMERLLEDGINAIGLGPQGMGGKYSVMGVNIENTARHPSTIGVAVNVGCWSHRRGHIVVNPDLTVTCDTHSTWKFNA